MEYKKTFEDLKEMRYQFRITEGTLKLNLRELKEKIKSKCDNMGFFCEQSKIEYRELKEIIKEIDALLGAAE